MSSQVFDVDVTGSRMIRTKTLPVVCGSFLSATLVQGQGKVMMVQALHANRADIKIPSTKIRN